MSNTFDQQVGRTGSSLKLAVLGGGGAGKSCLTMRYVQGVFVAVYDPTIEDSYRKQTQDDQGRPIVCEILDTAGTDQFSAMRDLYMKDSHGFLLVFSLLSKVSFQDAQEMYEQICRVKDTANVPIVLVGNKSDLPEQRVVSQEQIDELVNRWGAEYVEASAKQDINVDKAFATLIQKGPLNMATKEERAAERMKERKELSMKLKKAEDLLKAHKAERETLLKKLESEKKKHQEEVERLRSLQGQRGGGGEVGEESEEVSDEEEWSEEGESEEEEEVDEEALEGLMLAKKAKAKIAASKKQASAEEVDAAAAAKAMAFLKKKKEAAAAAKAAAAAPSGSGKCTACGKSLKGRKFCKACGTPAG